MIPLKEATVEGPWGSRYSESKRMSRESGSGYWGKNNFFFPNLFPLKYKQCEAKTKAITSIGIALKLILYI